MGFSSLVFLYCFLPACLVLYFISPNLRIKNIVLTVLSLVFYAWGEPVCVLLLIASAGINYICGRMIGREDRNWNRPALVIGVGIDLGLLAVFKYTGFFVENFNALTGLGVPVPNLALPIGISFFTFRTISYLADVSRGRVKAQRSFPNFLLYVAMFPQLIAGPIVRYADLEGQLQRRKTTLSGAYYGATRFFVGLGKKILLADCAGRAASAILDGTLTALPAADTWIGVVLFGFQIYFDFSGYSDMAVGLSRIFGFNCTENFNLPYTSKSATEFWRRWHITLGSFFRDYVYIPMGGNRRHQLLNLLVVWFLTGFWHGASWNFIFWGLYFFVLIYFEKRAKTLVARIPGAIQHILTVFLIELSWILFYNPDFTRMQDMLGAAFGVFGSGFANGQTLTNLTPNLPLLLVCAVGSTQLPRMAGLLFSAYCGEKKETWGEMLYSIGTGVFCFALLLLSTAAMVGQSYSPFLYFHF